MDPEAYPFLYNLNFTINSCYLMENFCALLGEWGSLSIQNKNISIEMALLISLKWSMAGFSLNFGVEGE